MQTTTDLAATSRYRQMACGHVVLGVLSLLGFLYFRIFSYYYLKIIDSAGVGHSIPWPVAHVYALLMAVLFCVAVSVGLCLRRMWAAKWALFTPLFALPMFADLIWAMVRWPRGASTDPASECNWTPIDSVVTTSLIVLTIWLVWTLLHWRALRGLVAGKQPERRTYAVLVSALVVATAFLPVFRMPCDGRMLIHDAAAYGWTPVVSLLVRTGQDIDTNTRFEWTPLYYAARAKQVNTVIWLVEHGADINKQRSGSLAPIGFAACGEGPPTFRPNPDTMPTIMALATRGAKPGSEYACMDMVCYLRNLPGYRRELVRLLVMNGWSPRANSFLLTYAVERGTQEDLDFLAAHGISRQTRHPD